MPGPTIGLDDVLANVKLDGQPVWFAAVGSLREARARFESEYIAAVLAQHHGRIPEAAKSAGHSAEQPLQKASPAEGPQARFEERTIDSAWPFDSSSWFFA